VDRGYDFEVSRVGKLATWVLYAALAFLIVTNEGVVWPVVLFWIGVCLALAAAAQYVLKARREVTP
jgi:phosphatidylglycerophosphate synthase